MTTYLGKSCSFCLPRVPFVNCRQFMYLVISPFGFEGRIWDLIVSVPDHCLSFYLAMDKIIMIVGMPHYYDNCGLSKAISLIKMYMFCSSLLSKLISIYA